ncbi:MAG: hypothetical protein Q4E28_02685 [Clostridia bacterium]|nr:hypothetical protein [Clostridia bacterium]
MNRYSKQIKLVVFDTAGTICDGPGDLSARWKEDDGKGCKAPVIPFHEMLLNHDIECDWATIRKPMGTYKPIHLKMLMEDASVKSQWMAKYGKSYDQNDLDLLLVEYRELLSKYIIDEDLAQPIAGTKECFERLREGGCGIGFDTGYFSSDAKALNDVLEKTFDIKADVTTNGEIVPGRPSPFMIFDCMQKMYEINHEAISCNQVVKVDDTAVGIESGNRAGAWTIGVYASGSDDYETLSAANPDFLVPDIKYVADIIFGTIGA